jgi:hypothetical protein
MLDVYTNEADVSAAGSGRPTDIYTLEAQGLESGELAFTPDKADVTTPYGASEAKIADGGSSDQTVST